MYKLQKRIESAVNRAKKANITPAELQALPAVQLLLANKKQQSFWGWYKIFVFAALVFGILAIYVHKKSPKDCLIPLPFDSYKLFRSPENCEMCRNVRGVERVSNLTPEEFEKRFAYTGRPVIITDGTKDWSAPDVFSFEFFRELYTELTPNQRDCQFFPYKTEFHSLTEALNMPKGRASLQSGTAPWYIGWSSCEPASTDYLRQFYTKPYFLPETSQATDFDWIFMGGPGPGAHLHVDDVRFPSWQAQLQGKKQWRLAPPPECYYVCEEFSVTVQPGEIIVVDTNRWYHQTLVVSNDLSITIGTEFD